jgi:soluble lytic murein transglycosylase-like protein
VKYIIAVILSALLILGTPKTDTPVNKVTKVEAKAKTVQVMAPEKAAEETQTPTEQKTIVTPAKIQVPQGCAAYVPLLQKYNWNVSTMAAVMQAESDCNPNAASPPNYDGLRDYGLMQLHGQEIYDPVANVAHAYAIWQRQGYRAWSTYNNGAYLRYL